MRLLLRILLILLILPPLMAAVMGWLAAPNFLHPVRRPLTPDLVRESDAAFAHVHARREDFSVTAPDGAILHGWKVRASSPNGNWVLVFHGVADRFQIRTRGPRWAQSRTFLAIPSQESFAL